MFSSVSQRENESESGLLLSPVSQRESESESGLLSDNIYVLHRCHVWGDICSKQFNLTICHWLAADLWYLTGTQVSSINIIIHPKNAEFRPHKKLWVYRGKELRTLTKRSNFNKPVKTSTCVAPVIVCTITIGKLEYLSNTKDLLQVNDKLSN
jgi:hypothetical protein